MHPQAASVPLAAGAEAGLAGEELLHGGLLEVALLGDEPVERGDERVDIRERGDDGALFGPSARAPKLAKRSLIYRSRFVVCFPATRKYRLAVEPADQNQIVWNYKSAASNYEYMGPADRCGLSGDRRERHPRPCHHRPVPRRPRGAHRGELHVLRLCAAAGLVSVDDLHRRHPQDRADAVSDKNRGGEWIRAEVDGPLAEATAADATEDTQPGLFGSAELPAELSTRTGRLARLEAALAEVEAQEAAARAETEERAAKARAAGRLRAANCGAANPKTLPPCSPGPRPTTPPH